MSLFSVIRKAEASSDISDIPLDEGKMERAMQMLAGEAEHINEDDPKQAANLMRRMSDMTGLELGAGMQEALSRMEKGEDPDTIEAEMGDLLEGEDPFLLPGKKGGRHRLRQRMPLKDDTLYDL